MNEHSSISTNPARKNEKSTFGCLVVLYYQKKLIKQKLKTQSAFLLCAISAVRHISRDYGPHASRQAWSDCAYEMRISCGLLRHIGSEVACARRHPSPSHRRLTQQGGSSGHDKSHSSRARCSCRGDYYSVTCSENTVECNKVETPVPRLRASELAY